MSRCQGMLPTHFLHNFEIVSPLFVTIHTRRVYILSSLYCKTFCTSLPRFCFLKLQPCINTHTPIPLSLIMISSLFLGMVCQFTLDDDVIWLQHLHDLFPQLSVHAHTSINLQAPYILYIGQTYRSSPHRHHTSYI